MFLLMESIKRELQRRPIYECRCDEFEDDKLKLRGLHVSDTLGGSGTPKDRDEVNRREVYEVMVEWEFFQESVVYYESTKRELKTRCIYMSVGVMKNYKLPEARFFEFIMNRWSESY
jgi:hypothetical protein